MVKASAENVITVLRKVMDIDLRDYYIHIDFTSDAVVDGPSAGVTMAVALYSALTGKAIDNKIAMTGKISINGMVRPIGGVIPKVRAAMRAGVERVLIPKGNWQEIFKSNEFAGVEIIQIETLKDALDKAIVKEDEDIEVKLDYNLLSTTLYSKSII